MTRLAKTAPKFTSPASTRMRILEMFPCKFGLEGCEAERARKDARLAKTAPKFARRNSAHREFWRMFSRTPTSGSARGRGGRVLWRASRKPLQNS